MLSSPQPEPRNLIRFWMCVVVGMAIWFSPTPAGLTEPAWHIFAVFAATIVSFLLRPLPMGVCVLIGILVLGASKDLFWAFPGSPEISPVFTSDLRKPLHISGFGVAIPSFSSEQIAKGSFTQSLSGFADPTTWLVVAAFLISGAMIRTGLGKRIALSMVSLFGRSMLGLGYSIGAAELLLAPFVPSNTARGGGVMAPVVNSLASVLGSHPEDSPKRAGEYLVLCGAHLNLVTAAMFLTGMAANPLVNKAAVDVLGEQHTLTWGGWLLGALVPGVVSLALLPLLLYWLARPAASVASDARDKARADLSEMGAWTGKQWLMAAILLGMLTLWVTAPVQKHYLGYSLPTALVALMGVATMVVLGVERWRDVTGNAAAWDTLIWLGGLVTMANALRETGFTGWFAEQVGQHATGLSPVAMAVTLALVYFFSMYAFSMLTGHIMALAGVFFAAGLAAGAPPLLMVALIAYFSNLCGCTTNYSTGPMVIYFGLGYVPTARWFRIGFVVALFHLGVWLGIGLPYWKLLGWW